MVTRVDRRVPLAVPLVGAHEAERVRQCVESGWVSTAGPWVGRFESVVADYVGVRHAIATCNGTAALHIALLAAGVQPGDLVLVPDLTFIAPVNAIRYCGAEPVFIDVDADRWQIDPAAVREFLTTETSSSNGICRERQSGRPVTALLPVHLLGLPAPVDELQAVAADFGLAFVQDAAQGLSAEYKGRRIGALGGVTTFSFNGNKIVTCGAGGVVVTDDDDIARRAQYLSTQAKDDALYFRHDHVGFNYRLSSLNAALGLAQFERLDDFAAIKRAIYGRYRTALAHRTDLRWVEEAAGDRASYWLASFVMAGGRDRRDGVLRALIDAGIDARPPWQPNHTQRPYSANLRGPMRRSLEIADSGMHLPSSVSLTDDDQRYVIDTLERALGA